MTNKFQKTISKFLTNWSLGFDYCDLFSFWKLYIEIFNKLEIDY